jgi:hypothetical protein
LIVLPALLLSGCETPANAGAQAPAASTAAVPAKPRCDRREVTGSRLARCDDGDVRVISGEEVRSTGMPGTGAGGGAAPRQ